MVRTMLTEQEKTKLKGLVSDIAELGVIFQLGTIGITLGLREMVLPQFDKWINTMQSYIKEYKELKRKELETVM